MKTAREIIASEISEIETLDRLPSEITDAILAALAAEGFSIVETGRDPETEKWKFAFAAQSRKLQAVLHVPGVREVLADLSRSTREGKIDAK